jgi:TRAP-type C4-dicarboxylate transport system substrate-binding protein
MLRIVLVCLVLVWSGLTASAMATTAIPPPRVPVAQAKAKPVVWQAQYPLAPTHPVVTEGWAPMAAALKPAVDLHLRLLGPRLGSSAALEALRSGKHQMGLLALASYPREFPRWAMLTESFLVDGDSLAAVAAVVEMVMLECPACQDSFARQNLVFLGTYAADPYRLIASGPLIGADSLAGQVVATPGSFWDRMVQGLGGSMAAVEANPRAALAAGRATALIDIAAALRDPKLAAHKLAVTTLPLGGYRGGGPFMINREAWSALSPAQRRRAFTAAAAGIVRITDAYRRNADAILSKAASRGVLVAEGTPALQTEIRRFAASDQARVEVSAKARFGVDDAGLFLARLKEIYDKYAVLLPQGSDNAKAIALLTSEIFDRLDAKTYGLH